MHYPVLLELDLAKRWKVTLSAVRNWRYRKVGPRWHKLLGKHVRYHVADILEFERTALPHWLAQQAVDEHLIRTGKPSKFSALDATDPPPDFVDARTAAALSKLPYHLFSNRMQRQRLQIPHMACGGLVRFSLLSLWRWERERSEIGRAEINPVTLPPADPAPAARDALRWHEIETEMQ
jgi:hypothetical protein